MSIFENMRKSVDRTEQVADEVTGKLKLDPASAEAKAIHVMFARALINMWSRKFAELKEPRK